jgi:hypothetical protein
MVRLGSVSLLLLAMSALPLGTGCSSEDGSEAATPSSEALRWRRHRADALATGGANGSSTASGGATAAGSASSASASSASVDAVIAAAQTPDGRAIPQPAGPGGACPAVVVAIGFWSCVTLWETCSYSAGGVTHSCTCTPVSGEGQYPAWNCD